MARLQELHRGEHVAPASTRRFGELTHTPRSGSDFVDFAAMVGISVRGDYRQSLEFLMSEADAEGIVVRGDSGRNVPYGWIQESAEYFDAERKPNRRERRIP